MKRLTFEDLIVQNAGTAQNGTLAQLYLYADKDLTTLLGSADVGIGATPIAYFDNVNIEIPATGVTYLYVAGYVKPIDYSSNPSADATADAATTIILKPLRTSGSLTSKVTGKVIRRNAGCHFDRQHHHFQYFGSLGCYHVERVHRFRQRDLSAGASQQIYSFKVTAPSPQTLRLTVPP